MQKGMSLFLQEQTCTNNGGPRWESVVCLFEQRLRASMIADYDIVFVPLTMFRASSRFRKPIYPTKVALYRCA